MVLEKSSNLRLCTVSHEHMLYTISTKHTVNWKSVPFIWLLSFSFPHDINTFAQLLSKRVIILRKDLCFHMRQLTASYEDISLSPPQKTPTNPIQKTLQKISKTLVNMSAHSSGAHKHQGKSRCWSKRREHCCERGELVYEPDVMSSRFGNIMRPYLQTLTHSNLYWVKVGLKKSFLVIAMYNIESKWEWKSSWINPWCVAAWPSVHLISKVRYLRYQEESLVYFVAQATYQLG